MLSVTNDLCTTSDISGLMNALPFCYALCKNDKTLQNTGNVFMCLSNNFIRLISRESKSNLG